MMMKALTLFLVSATTFVAGQDPLCRFGIAGTFGLAAACCPTFCGTCGGPGCDTRPGGPDNCCGQVIQASGRSCDTNTAPCTIQRDPECVTGLANPAEGICCARACGTTCGGVEGQGCERRFDVPAGDPTANRCCSANVRASNRPCATFTPPCTLAAAVVITPPVVVDPPVITQPIVIQPPPQQPVGCTANGIPTTKMGQCLNTGRTCGQCVTHFGKRRERRSLGKVNARHLVETSHPECTFFEYDMYLVVDGAHFAGLATPKHNNHGYNCPAMVFHTESYEANGHKLEKVSLHVDDDEVADLDPNNKLHLGTKPLIAIVNAFENAPVSKDGLLYDAISNNCVVMLRNMADPLNIPVDEKMLKFITTKLTSSASSHIVDMMQASPTLHALYENGRYLMGMTTEDLIAKVIQLYV